MSFLIPWRHRLVLLAVIHVVFAMTPSAQAAVDYPPKITADDQVTYKSIDGHDLDLWVFEPEATNSPRPAIVFFFGGGWQRGTPAQFVEQSKWLARRGMVAIIADYRVSDRHGTKAVAAVSDARSAVRFIRHNAERWGVDSQRIAAGGGSAGGHLAAATATIDIYDSPADDASTSAEPNALVLFNPALALGAYPGGPEVTQGAALERRMGVPPESISPAHNLIETLVPTVILHGTADRVVPLSSAEYFCNEARRHGSTCRLVTYDGEGHGFFNHQRSRQRFRETMTEVDRFLVEIGWIEAGS